MNDTQKIVELSKPIMGRRKIKMVLHEIYSLEQKRYNLLGAVHPR